MEHVQVYDGDGIKPVTQYWSFRLMLIDPSQSRDLVMTYVDGRSWRMPYIPQAGREVLWRTLGKVIGTSHSGLFRRALLDELLAFLNAMKL